MVPCTLAKENGMTTTGTLYLVATPIGNLGDMTLRALEVLREVDFVASEDTRKTGFLLKHFEIKKPQLSYHEHNEKKAGNKIFDILHQGQSVAIVTDAGTPGISDPGYTLVRRAIDENIPVTMAPGPAGLIMAVVLSGLPLHSFTFRGFPPRKSGPRKRFFGIDRESPHTLIFYESPHRIEDFLQDALEVYGDRQAAIANDLTKLYERIDRGSISELLQQLDDQKTRGEYIIVIEGTEPPPEKSRRELYAEKLSARQAEEDEEYDDDEDYEDDDDQDEK
jgi:16S rRNA (cytidine1402-2'-O)-methyltransferase